MTFAPSPSLILVARIGHYRLTRDANHPDFSLWRDGRIIAQGGQALTMKLFNDTEKGFEDVRNDMPDCCYCGRGPDICLCDGSGSP